MGELNDRTGSRDERIHHVSETPGIERFEPRPDARGRERVWAIGESRLHNYLLPRDCPRVTYYANAATTPADRRAFVCPHMVTPIAHREVPDPLCALADRHVELRVLSSLWPLRDAVVDSSLAFSIIRMRNAQPRDALTSRS